MYELNTVRVRSYERQATRLIRARKIICLVEDAAAGSESIRMICCKAITLDGMGWDGTGGHGAETGRDWTGLDRDARDRMGLDRDET